MTDNTTKILPVTEAEKQENNRNPSWFKPGQSGNPNGRPRKGHSITEIFKEMFNANPDKRLKLADKIYQAALQGDISAAKLIWQYMDGNPQQGMDITSKGDRLSEPPIIIIDK